MPNRILREGILTSDRVEQLDPPAEVFYRRLMSKVDDHGLFDARLSILRTHLFPLRVERVSEADIGGWLAACSAAGLLETYQHEGKPYLRMLDTKWATRSEPRYPLPIVNGCEHPQTVAHSCAQVHAVANSCAQLQTNDSSRSARAVVVVDVVGDVVVGEGKPPPRKRKAAETDLPADFGVSARVETWAKRHGFKPVDYLEAFLGKARAKGYRYVDWDEAFMNCIREDWPKLRQQFARAGPSSGLPAKYVDHPVPGEK